MDESGLVQVRDGRTDLHELAGQGTAFVAQRVVPGSSDDAGRQAGQAGMHRAEQGIGAAAWVGDPLLDKPVQVVCLQPSPQAGGLGHRRLPGRHRVALVAHAGSCQHSERTTGAVTSQSYPGGGVTAKLRQVVQSPPASTYGVLDRSRPGMLRCPPVIHCQDSSVGDVSQPTADGIVRLEISDHEAATVQVQRQRPRAQSRPVQPHP